MSRLYHVFVRILAMIDVALAVACLAESRWIIAVVCILSAFGLELIAEDGE
jgi:hypothetical protein